MTERGRSIAERLDDGPEHVHLRAMELNAGQQASLEALSRRFGLELIVLFGSAATGKMHEQSDIDLAVLCTKAPGFPEIAALTHELGKILGTPRVDVAVLNHADPLFFWQVMKSAKHLAGDPRTFARMRLLAFHRYQDFRPRLAAERKYVADFLAERP